MTGRRVRAAALFAWVLVVMTITHRLTVDWYWLVLAAGITGGVTSYAAIWLLNSWTADGPPSPEASDGVRA
ncbi:MAG: hypothetical protein KTV68_06900 [Acidimicrobiia bacterium]|nr:hypothetical protein [Acidimicrobiia bacterium]MCY4433293.1 hypothetical protein [bacterium]